MSYFSLTNMFACTTCGAVSKVDGKEHQHWHGFCPNCMSPMQVRTSNVKPECPEPKWKKGHPDDNRMVLVCFERLEDGVRRYEIDFWDDNVHWFFNDNDEVLGWCEIPEFDLEMPE